MTLTERLAAARDCPHTAAGVSLLTPISATHAVCYRCHGVIPR